MKISVRLLAGVALVGLLLGTSAVTGVPSRWTTEADALVTLSNVSYDSMLILAGDKHMCYRDMGNGLLCAGDNTEGQLGSGNNTSTLLAKQIKTSQMASPANLDAMAGGSNHICVVTSTGTPSGVVYCSGDNAYGQLGDGTTTDRNQPTAVADNAAFVNNGVTKVYAGGNSTCAVKTGALYCWGRNDQGQLGDGTTTDRSVPTVVASTFNTANTVMTSAGFSMSSGHTCATSWTGSYGLYCWGDNAYGQLGDGTTIDKLVPTAVTGVVNTQGTKAVGTTRFSTCAYSQTNNSVKCWGRNDKGQLGDGTNINRSSATAVDAGTDGFVNNANSGNFAGGGDTMCMHSGQTLYCFGDNSTNQVTSAATASYNTPTKIAPVGTFTNSGYIGNNGLAVSSSLTNGFVCYGRYCWGANANGQLSQNNTTAATSAVNIKTGTVTADSVSVPTISSATISASPKKITISLTGLTAGANLRVLITPPDYVQGTNFLSSTIVSQPTITNGGATVDVTYYMMSTGFTMPVSYNIDPTKTYKIKVMQEGGTTANVNFVDGFTSLYSTELTVTGSDSNTTTTTTPTTAVTTTTIVPSTTTTTAPKSVTTNTTVPSVSVGNYATAVPGVTVTDTKVYAAAPKKVSADSAIIAMTPKEAKAYDIVSKTPSVCLPNDNDLVFINDGKCIATVVNEKTRAVLRTLKTTVVDTDISTLKVGNEVVVLSPLYFDAGSSVIKATSAKRLTQLLSTIKKAGSILISGHSGNLMGNTPENQALSKMRAASVVTALKKLGATAPIAIAPVGALDPVSKGSSQADQDKNRRAVVVLIP